MTRHSKDPDAAFKQYREVTPDHVDDDTLRKLISKLNNNPEAINIALQHFWEDIGNKPSTDEWKTTNKTKKTEPEKPQPKSQSKIEERGGRGDKGGRGSGGRGDKGGRGVSAGRGAPSSSSSSEVPAPTTAAAVPAVSAAPAAPTTIANSTGKKDREKPARQPRPSSESTVAPIAAPKTAAWSSAGAGDNWAAHIKKKILEQEKEKELPPVPVDESKEDLISGRSKRKGKSKDKSGPSEEPSSGTQDLNNNVAKISIHDDNIGQTNTVKLTEIVPSLNQSPNRNTQSTQQQENEPPVSNQEQTTFFKMGKWEIPTPVEENAFQFGTFGSLGDNAAVSHSSSWGVVPDSVTNQNSDNSSSWSSNQNNDISASNNSNMGSVLLGNNNAANSNLGNRYTPKTNELEPQQQKTQNRNAPGQNRNNKHEQNQQYGQYQAPPPGIPTPAGRGPVASVPYSYGGVYDQSQYYSPAAPIAAPVAVGTTGTAAGASNVNSAAPTSASAPATTPAPQQAPQQQYPPGMNGNPYGFYPPYGYPNGGGYYFGGQFPNAMYSQGRNVYQPPRAPYDPYGSAQSLYGDVYQSGQFPDSTGNYGNMTMHPSQMPLPVAGNNAGSKTKSASSAVAGSQVPDHNAHSAYNPYPYNRDAQQWPYQQNAGWGGPIMMSSAPAQQIPQQGFSQQSTQSNGREAQRSNPSGASIHGGSAGSFVRGSAGSEQRW